METVAKEVQLGGRFGKIGAEPAAAMVCDSSLLAYLRGGGEEGAGLAHVNAPMCHQHVPSHFI